MTVAMPWASAGVASPSSTMLPMLPQEGRAARNRSVSGHSWESPGTVCGYLGATCWATSASAGQSGDSWTQ